MPPKATMELQCEVCKQRHAFDMTQCSILDDNATENK